MVLLMMKRSENLRRATMMGVGKKSGVLGIFRESGCINGEMLSAQTSMFMASSYAIARAGTKAKIFFFLRAIVVWTDSEGRFAGSHCHTSRLFLCGLHGKWRIAAIGRTGG